MVKYQVGAVAADKVVKLQIYTLFHIHFILLYTILLSDCDRTERVPQFAE